MNNPNPFHPQVSLLEQKNRKRARVKVAVFSIFAFNILLISPLLIQGCRDKGAQATDTSSATPTNPDATSTANATPTTPDTNVSNATPAPLPPTPANNVTPTVANNPPPGPPPSAITTDYTIVKGDTLSKIASAHGVSLKALVAANPGLDPAKLQIGKKVQIPPPTTAATTSSGTAANVADSGDLYVVKSGDSLTKIAHEHGTTVKAIRTANDLKSNKILVGQKLKMPAAGSSAPAAPASADTATPSVTPSTTSVNTTTPPPPASGGVGGAH